MMGLTFPGGMQMDLLWQNPNPTQAFAVQNIELDLSPYKAAIIRYRDATNPQISPTIDSGIYFVDNTRALMVQVGENTKNNYTRSVRLEPTMAHFSDCGTESGAALNTVAVPYQIYGIQF